ncbi:MAG: porphobilinogen synthase [Planctomycetes bacterium]|nr:porphobilinogen synthase [Planctomycetota bacterium]
MAGFPTRRLRRLRQNPTLRRMLGGARLSMQEMICPLFVTFGQGVRRPIESLPGHFQISVDAAVETARDWAGKGVQAVLLFGIPQHKDACGSGACDPQGPVQQLVSRLKKDLPDLLVITDVCLCDYTDHGHCGLLKTARDGALEVGNDRTLEVLAKIAVSHAQAGADVVAPSAMMDGQVAAIRQSLDQSGLADTAIMSYTVKFASCFYQPFRDAADCAPKFGDRTGYQMDFRTAGQAVAEARQDIEEGADMIMVKPAGPYLDIIARVRQSTDAPLAAYQVSGEYSAIKAAAAAGWLNERSAAVESLTAIKRAGADLIITYFAPQLGAWI